MTICEAFSLGHAIYPEKNLLISSFVGIILASKEWDMGHGRGPGNINFPFEALKIFLLMYDLYVVKYKILNCTLDEF